MTDARICLVSMPFTPMLMPGLGVSTLKSVLVEAGFPTDLYYGSLDFFRWFYDGADPQQALYDHDFVAVNNDLGNTFLVGELWGDQRQQVVESLREVVSSPNPVLDQDDMLETVGRLEKLLDRVEGFYEYCYGKLNWDEYDIVGFSSTFGQNIPSLQLARRIKDRHPRVTVIFGGANCEGDMGRQLLRSFPYIDYVQQGEADRSLLAFVRALGDEKELALVPGLLRRDSAGHLLSTTPPQVIEDMDSLPIPIFDDYFKQLSPPLQTLLKDGILSLPVETSRGCWWGMVQHCIFCGLNPTTMSFRSKSPDRAVREILSQRDRYGIHRIYAVDNIIDRRYFKEVLPRLEGKGLHIFYETKSNLFERDVAGFARAGVTRIQPGIEGLTSEILQLMKKGIRGYKNLETLKWCATYGVSPAWTYLYRFPNEPIEPYQRDIKQFPRFHHLPPPRTPNPVIMDRYSPIYTKREEYGFRNVRPVRRTEIYYRGLYPEERFAISYHFEAEMPQGEKRPYELPLWDAVLEWYLQHLRGARFYQFRGERVTLLIDRRDVDAPQSFLLTGNGHKVHDFLRLAHTRSRVHEWFREGIAEPPSALYSPDDLYLYCVGQELGARSIAAPDTAAGLDRFLDELEELAITVHMDDRDLALAVDCTSVDEARRFALEDYAFHTGVSAEGAGALPPEVEAAHLHPG